MQISFVKLSELANFANIYTLKLYAYALPYESARIRKKHNADLVTSFYYQKSLMCYRNYVAVLLNLQAYL